MFADFILMFRQNNLIFYRTRILSFALNFFEWTKSSRARVSDNSLAQWIETHSFKLAQTKNSTEKYNDIGSFKLI